MRAHRTRLLLDWLFLLQKVMAGHFAFIDLEHINFRVNSMPGPSLQNTSKRSHNPNTGMELMTVTLPNKYRACALFSGFSKKLELVKWTLSRYICSHSRNHRFLDHERSGFGIHKKGKFQFLKISLYI